MSNSTAILPQTRKSDSFTVSAGVTGMRIVFVNVYFVCVTDQANDGWVLIDAGLKGSAERIKRLAAEQFGDTRPKAILLTHGHFDHVGALEDLLTEWDVPVYAHSLEMPYLTGRSDYPPPDPSVGGGGMAWLSWMYPKGPIDLKDRVKPLPSDGSIPGLPGWRWYYTPGHAPGHISFFRENDRTLIAGDAFVTTNQESVLSVLTQKPEIHAPPAYFTSNWQDAHRSVELLSRLNPSVVATGHGIPMHGPEMQEALRVLAHDFKQIGIPKSGRYVKLPALTNEEGVVSLPPPVHNPVLSFMVGFGVALVVTSLVVGVTQAQEQDVQSNA